MTAHLEEWPVYRWPSATNIEDRIIVDRRIVHRNDWTYRPLDADYRRNRGHISTLARTHRHWVLVLNHLELVRSAEILSMDCQFQGVTAIAGCKRRIDLFP